MKWEGGGGWEGDTANATTFSASKVPVFAGTEHGSVTSTTHLYTNAWRCARLRRGISLFNELAIKHPELEQALAIRGVELHLATVRLARADLGWALASTVEHAPVQIERACSVDVRGAQWPQNA
jgi:hypothetical protein